MWVVKSTTSSLDPTSYEAKIVSDNETISTPHRTKPRLSCEAKPKALYANSETVVASLTFTTLLGSGKPAAREANTKVPLHANSVADSASLPLIAPSTKNLCSEARDKAPLSANSEAILTSLEGKALYSKTKLTSKGRIKAVVSACEATLPDEAILISPLRLSVAHCSWDTYPDTFSDFFDRIVSISFQYFLMFLVSDLDSQS